MAEVPNDGLDRMRDAQSGNHDYVYIGRSRKPCGHIVAGWVERDYDRTEEVMDMLKRGLIVERVPNEPAVALQGCEECIPQLRRSA